MIVVKFGGTSVADAERIRGAAGIVAARIARRPVVVVSALAGVTDLLEAALSAALAAEREPLETILADLERRHRWAASGAIEDAARRHVVGLDLDARLDGLRGRLRSIRILGEATARARDAVLATGESLSTKIVAAAFEDAGLPAVAVEATRVMITDARHGGAEADLAAVEAACGRELHPLVEEGRVPVVGGYVGSTPDGEITTLGRGGSDTSAAVLGLALGAEEIQIWSDVDGLMTADPRLVPAARSLPLLSFAEATELSLYGARVLHPPSIAPAVRQRIPVRVLNSMRPEGIGTLIVDEPQPSRAPVAVASRRGFRLVRASDPRMRADGRFAADLVTRACSSPTAPELVVSAGVTVTMVLRQDGVHDERVLGVSRVESREDRALVAVVGGALVSDAALSERVLSRLVRWQPDLTVQGGSRTSLLAVVGAESLAAVVGDLHRSFFEQENTG